MTKHRLTIIGKGLVASAIAKQAATTYGSVTMVSRSKPLEMDQLPDHVSHVQGNALHPSPFSDVIRSADAVVSTVGVIKESKDEDGTFERLNRDAVLSVAREMVKTQPPNLDRRCLVYFSAANAPPGFLLDPRYINTKREAEEALLSNEFKDKLRVVIVRPGIIYSMTQRKFMLPIAVETMLVSALLRPFRHHLPDAMQFIADKPLADDIVSMAVLEAIKKPDVQGIIGVDEIQELSNLWRKRQ
ncbi:hypothetical protein INT44_003320 [Umbelopsis vinacea]|uniref:NAD(P)-binding domain-containing protein n=1 Tax=Umbelopsis vinacea TaxID=44442 RepID=A0A8H7PU87_9FUNG|nr:hypothetical protein INT44_003320 [Umbelopsis vinacea]